ncbi:zf-DHHC-domain-containing protein [Rhizodiscina lignyota]|uniref:Palmitoyltransferase n=1 Tax=Rhizodiscina lignyota TaxID=1504668 RepID=A0A9P4IJD5_9PEZI|nr:zf-DHHC-domain-containing protein [Rhizodiscina lignyota]
MATLGSPSPPSSPSHRRRPKAWARKVERFCCGIITYFPLTFIYGLTSWAAWVEVGIGLRPEKALWTGYFSSFLGLALYLLLNSSYTIAVFTDPGSPLNTKDGYSHLATEESGNHPYTSFTVKSTGDIRFCKKCECKKPDRTHHCSTCKRCVLKMDHHCPWLATCVGLHNYKPFLLFLIYTCLFCWLCFAATASWLWSEVLSDNQFTETLMPVNYILLCVLSGIIGLVLTGFTGWHIWLASVGRTTIESLEKTRYLAPLRHSMQEQYDAQRHSINGFAGSNGYAYGNGRPSISDQLREIHANALPGVTRPEEGEERSSPAPHFDQHYSSPAHSSLRQTYDNYESRERGRYEDYLDEQDSNAMPNAFDLGLRRNLLHIFGEKWWLWWLPVCNTTGDGWSWEASPKWLEAREKIASQREARIQEQALQGQRWGNDYASSPTMNGAGRFYDQQQGMLGGYNRPARPPQRHHDNATPLQTLSRTGSPAQHSGSRANPTENWNDVPEDFLNAGARRPPDRPSSRNRIRRKDEQWQSWGDGGG